MRLRYMELPSVVVGDLVQTPFVLIFDRCTDAEVAGVLRDSPSIAKSSGARAAFAFGHEVDLDA